MGRNRHQCIEFTAGIGGTANIDGRVASANSVEFDPSRSSFNFSMRAFKVGPPGIAAHRELSPMAGVKQYETDIAIVGAGGAGIAAGIEARDAGAHAIVFEKSSEAGGAAIISGGGCLIVGSPLQQKNGIHDTPDLAFKDWIAWGGA